MTILADLKKKNACKYYCLFARGFHMQLCVISFSHMQLGLFLHTYLFKSSVKKIMMYSIKATDKVKLNII